MIYNETQQCIISTEYKVARTLLQRFCGLMLQRKYTEPLLFKNCTQIHTFFMLKKIHILYLNDDYKVKEIERNLKPWRIGKKSKGCIHIIEFDYRDNVSAKKGDKLIIK